MNQAVIAAPVGSIETCCGCKPDGTAYSLRMPVPGKKKNILSLDDSVPITASDPDTVVKARLVGAESGVGIAHSRNVLVAGSRWATLLPADSTNQQQLPEGSNASPVGMLLGVGTVHSVSAPVEAEAFIGAVRVAATVTRGEANINSTKAAATLTKYEQIAKTAAAQHKSLLWFPFRTLD